jgi:hypothetical protein
VVEDGRRPAQVPVDGRGEVVALQDLQALGDGDRVDVHIDHPGVGGEPLRDLVDVADRRHARAEVQELAYTGFGQVTHHAV